MFDPEALLKSRRARPVAVEEIKKARVIVDPDIALATDVRQGLPLRYGTLGDRVRIVGPRPHLYPNPAKQR
ncbi:hypothetical protein WCLP8_880002 [uncultured Gammaproteobacteria bacterium]